MTYSSEDPYETSATGWVHLDDGEPCYDVEIVQLDVGPAYCGQHETACIPAPDLSTPEKVEAYLS